LAHARTPESRATGGPAAGVPVVPDRGSIGLRYAGFGIPLALEGRLTFGSESGEGWICYGFIQPGDDCVLEPVRYSGGSFLGAVGVELHRELGDRADARLRPSIGLGAVWSGDRGRETGKEVTDLTAAVAFGLAGEVGLRPWATHRGGLAMFYRVEQLKAWAPSCEDCRNLFRSSLRRQALGVAIRW
jgi:hypothetical protein